MFTRQLGRGGLGFMGRRGRSNRLLKLNWKKLYPFMPEPQRFGEVNSKRGVTKKVKGQK